MPKVMSKVSKGKKQGGKPKKQSTGGKGAAAKKSTRKESPRAADAARGLAKKAAPKARSAGKTPARGTAAKKGGKAVKAAKTKGAKQATLSKKPAPGAKPAAVKVRSAAPGRNDNLPSTVGPRPFAPPPAVEGTGEPSGTNGVSAQGNLPIERGGGGGADTGPM